MDAEEINQGAHVLDMTERWMSKFVHFPSATQSTIATLWIAGVHMTGAATPDSPPQLVHRAYARLGFVSDEPGSGKTTAMERALALCPRGELIIQPSLAGIMDAIEERQTVGLDEADKYFGKKGGAQPQVIGFINAGYRQGGGTVRFKGRKVDSFAPMLYSGLLEALGVNPALYPLRTRSMLLEMHPAPYGVDVTEYDDERHDYPQDELRDALASWGKLVAPRVPRVPVPDVEGVRNRRAQLWRPLFRVAILAGGDWPEKAFAACRDLESGISAQAPALTPSQRIMADIRNVAGGVRISTTELIRRLHAIEGAPYRYVFPDPTGTGEARELAEMLAPHGLAPDVFRFVIPELGTMQKRGYDLSLHSGCTICPPEMQESRSQTDGNALWTDDIYDVTDDADDVTDVWDVVTDAVGRVVNLRPVDPHVIVPPAPVAPAVRHPQGAAVPLFSDGQSDMLF
jgi:hypothetical protein